MFSVLPRRRRPRPSSPTRPVFSPTRCTGSPGPCPNTLLLIDEAGMADTLTLDTAATHVLERGGRVCLVGDDHQLDAIGASGILTNLEAAHGAIRLTQLHRFTDPDEAAATLQVRAGQSEVIDFYTD